MSKADTKQTRPEDFELPLWLNWRAWGCLLWVVAVIAGWAKLKLKDW